MTPMEMLRVARKNQIQELENGYVLSKPKVFENVLDLRTPWDGTSPDRDLVSFHAQKRAKLRLKRPLSAVEWAKIVIAIRQGLVSVTKTDRGSFLAKIPAVMRGSRYVWLRVIVKGNPRRAVTMFSPIKRV